MFNQTSDFEKAIKLKLFILKYVLNNHSSVRVPGGIKNSQAKL